MKARIEEMLGSELIGILGLLKMRSKANIDNLNTSNSPALPNSAAGSTVSNSSISPSISPSANLNHELNSSRTVDQSIANEAAENDFSKTAKLELNLNQNNTLNSDGQNLLQKNWVNWYQRRFLKGYQLDLVGAHDAADRHYYSVIKDIEETCLSQPDSISSYAFGRIALQHGARLVSLGKYFPAEAALLTALHSFQTTLSGDGNVRLVREIALASSWLGRVRYLRGDLEYAAKSYRNACNHWRSAIKYDGNLSQRQRSVRMLATALKGLSRTLSVLGIEEESSTSKSEAQDLLTALGQQASLN